MTRVWDLFVGLCRRVKSIMYNNLGGGEGGEGGYKIK